MRFEPKTEEQVQQGSLLEPGEYDFEVVSAEEKVSAKGNDMIKLRLTVFTADGGQRTIFDYLMDAVPHKVRHFAYATGLNDAYDSGALDANDCMGRAGRCKVRIEKDKAGAYPDRNTIADYLVAEAKPAAAAKPAAPPIKPGGIPTRPAPAHKELTDADLPF